MKYAFVLLTALVHSLASAAGGSQTLYVKFNEERVDVSADASGARFKVETNVATLPYSISESDFEFSPWLECAVSGDDTCSQTVQKGWLVLGPMKDVYFLNVKVTDLTTQKVLHEKSKISYLLLTPGLSGPKNSLPENHDFQAGNSDLDDWAYFSESEFAGMTLGGKNLHFSLGVAPQAGSFPVEKRGSVFTAHVPSTAALNVLVSGYYSENSGVDSDIGPIVVRRETWQNARDFQGYTRFPTTIELR